MIREIKELPLKDISKVCDGINILEWEYVSVGNSCRLYYKTKILGEYSENQIVYNGFDFYTVNMVCFEEKEFSDNSFFEILLYGVACFDGIRHLHFGKDLEDDKYLDNEGYFYYPNMKMLIKMLEELMKLEEKYCTEYER